MDIEGLDSGSYVSVTFFKDQNQQGGKLMISMPHNIADATALLTFAVFQDTNFRMAVMAALKCYDSPEIREKLKKEGL